MEEIIFDKSSEEYKAIEWLKNKTNDYSEHSLILHYNNILYYLIIYLMKKNKKIEEKINMYENPEDLTLMFMYCAEKTKDKIKELQERINKAIEYIHSTEYQYGDLEQDGYDYNMCFNEVEDLLKILKGNKI